MKLRLQYINITVMLFFNITSMAQYTQSDWKDRDEWMNVKTLLNLAEITPGDKVADIGCHEGYLSMHLAKAVEKKGTVYAVDVRNDRLEELKRNGKERNLFNVNTILGDYDNPKLPENSLDIVFVIDTYHEMDAHKKMLSHIKKSLKLGGRIVMLEKLKKHMRNKTRNQQANAHTLAMKFAKKELKIAGFTILNEIENFGNWERDPDKIMWVVVAEKD